MGSRCVLLNIFIEKQDNRHVKVCLVKHIYTKVNMYIDLRVLMMNLTTRFVVVRYSLMGLLTLGTSIHVIVYCYHCLSIKKKSKY